MNRIIQLDPTRVTGKTKELFDGVQASGAHRLIALLEEADTECCADIRGPLLTFVVAGGGFAGVETVAAINDFVRHRCVTAQNHA